MTHNCHLLLISFGLFLRQDTFPLLFRKILDINGKLNTCCGTTTRGHPKADGGLNEGASNGAFLFLRFIVFG